MDVNTITASIADLTTAIDTSWTLLGAALVFFMQAGFCMVEAGFTRAKNAGNIIMKNLMDFCLGTPIFWLLGAGLMFGGTGALIGGIDVFATGLDNTTLIFQTVFCATAATIVSGAMAERTKFSAYCIYSMVISAVIYPISGHWIWGGGWLSQLGFHDFAGSCAVHMVGGVAAIIGAAILGPRIGKYTKDGKSKAIQGHSMTLGALGVFILWFAWFGFNGCSTVAMSSGAWADAARIFVTTNLSAVFATITCMLFTWIRYGKPDVSMTLNASLAGLVMITAGCDMVSPIGAAVMGIVAGFAVVIGIEFVDKKLKIDDPVGAFGVHGVNGALGTILTGVFATDGGLLYGGGFRFLGVQILGVVSVIAWVAVTMIIVFNILKHTVGLRVSEEEEIVGLDSMEHGLASAYADFMPAAEISAQLHNIADEEPEVSVEEAIPVTEVSESSAPGTMHKVVIITKQSAFDGLQHAMADIGIRGLTVTNVLGCGTQKGATKMYRGVEVDITLRPKVKVEMVVSTVPVSKVVETAKSVLYTGHIGDGKIFIYAVENVIKVRTGEEGPRALRLTD